MTGNSSSNRQWFLRRLPGGYHNPPEPDECLQPTVVFVDYAAVVASIEAWYAAGCPDLDGEGSESNGRAFLLQLPVV